jgi:hypothetical protein
VLLQKKIGRKVDRFQRYCLKNTSAGKFIAKFCHRLQDWKNQAPCGSDLLQQHAAKEWRTIECGNNFVREMVG